MLLYKHRIQIEIYALANHTFNILNCHFELFWGGHHTIFGKHPSAPNLNLNQILFKYWYNFTVLKLKMYNLTEITHLTVVCWCLYWVNQGNRKCRPCGFVQCKMIVLGIPILSFIECAVTFIWNIIITFTHDASSVLLLQYYWYHRVIYLFYNSQWVSVCECET